MKDEKIFGGGQDLAGPGSGFKATRCCRAVNGLVFAHGPAPGVQHVCICSRKKIRRAAETVPQFQHAEAAKFPDGAPRESTIDASV